MTGAGGVKEAQYNEIDLRILDILGKDNLSLEGLDGDDCFQAYETVADKQQAKLPTSQLPVGISSPSSVRHDNTGLRHTMCVTHCMILPSCT